MRKNFVFCFRTQMQALRIKGKINLPTFDKMSEAK